MKNHEKLPNGIDVIYAFGHIPDIEKKTVLFLAGTTSWNADLVNDSWRRYFIKLIGQETGLRENIAVCIPEPRFGKFTEKPVRHLIEWETEYLDIAKIHVYWLNTYWTYNQAIQNTSEDTVKYYADGRKANIGVTVRTELGASFGRYKYGSRDFKLVIGAPADAEGLAWILIQSKLAGLPVFTLYNILRN